MTEARETVAAAGRPIAAELRVRTLEARTPDEWAAMTRATQRTQSPRRQYWRARPREPRGAEC